MSDRRKILDLFVGKLIAAGNFTVQGVEKAFEAFVNSLEERNVAPPPKTNDGGEYIKTSLKAAADAAKRPIFILYFNNDYGNKESQHIKGLLIDEDEIGAYAYGVQDGPNVLPLTMREVTACMANGFRYKGANTSGSAQHATDSNRI